MDLPARLLRAETRHAIQVLPYPNSYLFPTPVESAPKDACALCAHALCISANNYLHNFPASISITFMV